jgi:hypothetical protein
MRTYRLSCVIAMFASTALLAGPQPTATEPTVATVLQRAAAYVEQFHRRLSSIVAEEHYVQEWYLVRPGGRTSLDRRELRSDLVLMKPGSDAPWMEFRDVFEVDGRAVRDRDDRLEILLRQPSGVASAQMSAILRESARFNIGDVDRNVNTPLFALRFLEAGNQARFRFRRAASGAPGASTSTPEPSDGVFRVATEVWAIAYDEVRRGTMIRNAERKDQPAHGRFWIEPATGRVLVSELRVEDRSVRASIDVSFQSEPLMDLLVPVAMRERYEGKRTGSLVEGRATYGRFRQLRGGANEPQGASGVEVVPNGERAARPGVAVHPGDPPRR